MPVVYNNQQEDVDQQDPNAQVPTENSGDEEAMGEDEVQIQEGAEGSPPDGTEPPGEDEEYDLTQAPPPSGFAGFIKSRKFKFIIIGIVIFIIFLILLAFILPREKKDETITLTWWGLWEDNATMQPIIDDFEKQNPNIKIQYIKQDPENYRDTLVTRIKNGKGPDIFHYHNTWTKPMISLLAPLPKDVITAQDFTKQYYPVIQKDLTQSGAIYGIPLGIDTVQMFINNDLFSTQGLSAPTDWNQFKKAAIKLTVKDNDTQKILTSGAALGTYNNIRHAPDIISMMFLQQGIDMNNFDKSIDEINSALTFYTSYAKGSDRTWDSTLDDSLLAFSKGDLAIYFGFSWDIFIIEQIKASSAKSFEYAVYPVPAIQGTSSISVASYWAEGVSARSKNQKAAMLFMNYLTQKSTLQKLYTESSKKRLFGELYPRVDMADELKDNALIYPFVSNLEIAGSSYFASDTRDGETGINSRLNTYLENYVNNIINSNAGSDSEFKNFTDGVAKVLNDNGIK